MVSAQVDALRSLLRSVTSDLDPAIKIECGHFFTGAAAYANGRIFMTLTSVGVALKLPQDARAVLIGKGAKPLRYFPRGPIKKDYVIVPDRITRVASALAPWVAKSVVFSQTFPKKKRRAARRRS